MAPACSCCPTGKHAVSDATCMLCTWPDRPAAKARTPFSPSALSLRLRPSRRPCAAMAPLMMRSASSAESSGRPAAWDLWNAPFVTAFHALDDVHVPPAAELASGRRGETMDVDKTGWYAARLC